MGADFVGPRKGWSGLARISLRLREAWEKLMHLLPRSKSDDVHCRKPPDGSRQANDGVRPCQAPSQNAREPNLPELLVETCRPSKTDMGRPHADRDRPDSRRPATKRQSPSFRLAL